MGKFKLVSNYTPKGDQPKAIEQLVLGLKENKKYQVLLGATGTGKTFTVANVIAQINKPTLVFVHNKTLAGQLYSELKELFPHNHVEYFVSNFDYYQPEAYLPKTDTYIEKNSMINEELDMLRLAAYNAVLEHRDTIIVASVACIYAASDPNQYKDLFFTIKVNQKITRKELLMMLVDRQYNRNDFEQKRGTFRVRGDVIDVSLGHTDNYFLRIELFDDEIDRISEIDTITNKTLENYTVYNIFPATGYAKNKEDILKACENIEIELKDRLEYFEKEKKLLEKQRLQQRCAYDLEALREFGVCPGIENYSRHLEFRAPGSKPWTLFDYFDEDFLLIVDESHVSFPQVRGMYNGDRSRKETLVNFGFRLPSALDNRPLKFKEFEKAINQVICVSATPGDYELEKVKGQIVEQIIRPTGLLDPEVEVRPSKGQIDDLAYEIDLRMEKEERVLVTTLTVKMAEELTKYLQNRMYKVAYLHHETKTLERIEIIRDLRKGKYDVLVGINLLREGLDIPEVSLVAIIDADKEGFLRSERSLIQTIGRAARNSNGKVIMYGDNITGSMSRAIEETNRRRKIQQKFNEENGIIPTTIKKEIREPIRSKETHEMAIKYMSKKIKKQSKTEIEQLITRLDKEMREAARILDFERAAQLRDMILEIKGELG
ncbi:MAG TPA: excinuclease ABC subunit UvrB [Erysipelotrichaceae bacterium]|jgi:excinuclease ABC subunit B|nr:excinuclease ABC subunit UvrB [Erysipelotrichia bacterium]HPX31969.1 excinuclease ABC subunit UvrB [Erysipelotrichaceae bacterium]HQA84481.1 excinuclease ABC subunit UvrB [Erysipelotrichaceae bacterium]